MKKFLVLILFALSITSCQRGCQRLDKQWQVGERNYEVIMYSGGNVVFHDQFRGIINDAEGSDGCYYTKEDTLIEISGDYILKSTD